MGNVQSEAKDTEIGHSIASLGCCQNGVSGCCASRSSVSERAADEVGRIQLVKKSKTAYTPGLTTSLKQHYLQHSSVTEVGKPHPSYSPEEKAKVSREVSPAYSSDMSHANTPRKAIPVVEEWDADYGMKIVFRREDADEQHKTVPLITSHQNYAQPTRVHRSYDRSVESRSVTPPYIALSRGPAAKQPTGSHMGGQGALIAVEDSNPPRAGTPQVNNQTLNLSPIAASGVGYPASPSPVRGNREHLHRDMQGDLSVGEFSQNVQQPRFAPIHRTASAAQRIAADMESRPSLLTHIEGLQICTPYK